MSPELDSYDGESTVTPTTTTTVDGRFILKFQASVTITFGAGPFGEFGLPPLYNHHIDPHPPPYPSAHFCYSTFIGFFPLFAIK